ncbi:MAG: Thioredoxin [Mycoplasmataceae bacterium]|nr:MAG: Thioredoxin [Mycoplasmataceae bacterium]
MKILIDDIQKLNYFLKEDNFHESILVKFSTKWCSPCKKLQNVINDFDKERPDVLILEIDAEKSFEISQDPAFNILSVPTIFLFKNGELLRRVEGYIDLESLKKIF